MGDIAMDDVTRILSAIDRGEPAAAEELLPLVYDDLRRLAARKLAKEKPGQTLQATALVHEAYLRIAGGGETSWESRRHFFAAAAEAMRRILIDRARHKQSAKASGHLERVALDDGPSLAAPEGTSGEDLLALDEALEQFEAVEPVKARLVKLRYFAGVSVEDAAEMLDISPATARRYWIYARSWLYGKLHGE
jgi:RNA polymerase sigma factor (TIGR02999 family)